jgi:hypothetical protein
MSVFGVLKSDEKVFTGDKIRFDANQSYVTSNDAFATVSHEISFDAGVTWINISAAKKIDFGWSTAGAKEVRLRVTSTAETQTVTKTITVLNLTTQALFSNDSDLYRYEPEVDQYLPKKWSSWNLIHLQAQQWILDWLDESRIYKYDGSKYGVADFGDSQQVKQLSTYKVLEMIFEGNSNVVGDLFSIKRDKYKALAQEKCSRSNLRLDYDNNGTIDTNEKIDLFSGELTRG